MSNFYPLEIVGRGCETQQVGEDCNKLSSMRDRDNLHIFNLHNHYFSRMTNA